MNATPQVSNQDKETILVVDDDVFSLAILKRLLDASGYHVVSTSSPDQTVHLARKHKPSVILLDIVMPKFDGIAVCQALKEDPELRIVPVIFLTALSDRESLIRGLSSGAADYLTKPIDISEALARIQAQISCYKIFRENIKLQNELLEARRASTVSAVSAGFVHNLNNLLMAAIGYAELAMLRCSPGDSVSEVLEKCLKALNRMSTVVGEVATVTEKLPELKSTCNVAEVLRISIGEFSPWYPGQIHVSWKLAKESFLVRGEVEALSRALKCLIQNAIESYETNDDVDVQVVVSEHKDSASDGVSIRVIDSGRGLSESVRYSLFEPFVSTKRQVGVGMGLTVARYLVERCGGRISVNPGKDKGVVAEIFLRRSYESGSDGSNLAA